MDHSKKEKKKNNQQQQQDSNSSSLEELKQLSSYFSRLIDTIPAKVYFSQNSDVLENIEVNKRAIFEDSNLSNKAKNKRIKLDPTTYQKVSDVANAFHEKKKTEGKMGELRKKLAKRIKEFRSARGAGEPKAKKGKKRTASESSLNGTNENGDESESDRTMPKIYNKEGKRKRNQLNIDTNVRCFLSRKSGLF